MAVDEKVKEIVDKLEQGLKEVFESDNYKNYLNTMAKFHNYSLNNTLLINQQAPNATRVAGFESWKNNFNRHVKKGERGIKIIAPAPYTMKVTKDVIDPKTGEVVFDENGDPKKAEVQVKIPAFKVTTVFDISQTEGEPLPSLGVNELSGNVEMANDIKDSLFKISPVPIKFGEIDGGSKGFYSLSDKYIKVKEGMSDTQTLKTMVHEISHAMLHDPDRIKENPSLQQPGNREVEAESIAYIVCQHFGIDTSDYSFGYIAGWSEGREMDDLKASMNTIRETSAEMINRIEGNLRAIEKDRNVEIGDAEKTVEANLSSVKEAKTNVDSLKKAKEPETKEQPKEPEIKTEPKIEVEKKKEPERKSIRSKLADKQKEVDKQKKDKSKNKQKAQEI